MTQRLCRCFSLRLGHFPFQSEASPALHLGPQAEAESEQEMKPQRRKTKGDGRLAPRVTGLKPLAELGRTERAEGRPRPAQRSPAAPEGPLLLQFPEEAAEALEQGA